MSDEAKGLLFLMVFIATLNSCSVMDKADKISKQVEEIKKTLDERK